VKKDFKLIIDNEGLENQSATDAGGRDELQRWPLFGLSVGSFLQVIAMERQTCMMEVYLDADHWGHFCFVEGDLYDAVSGAMSGEKAAMEMISWENVRLNIKQILNTTGLTRKIDKNLMLLLMESTRLRDEGGDDENQPDPEVAEDSEDREVVADHADSEKLSACLNIMVKDMGDALTAVSIVDVGKGKVLASYHTAPETAEAFSGLTNFLQSAFRENTQAVLGDHLILDLKNQQTLVLLLFGEQQWCIVFDNVKCTLGLLRNVVMPKVIRTFNEMK
jgi:hypothetical protein